MSSKVDRWKKLREKIIAQLDIKKKYEEWGVKFTGKVSSKGWAECHSHGRDDKNPSAGVNLATGHYNDFATGDVFSLFDFAAEKVSVYDSWRDAQDKLARELKLAKFIPKDSNPQRAKETIARTKTWQPIMVMKLCKSLGITPELLQQVGAFTAMYPKKSREPQLVVAFPVYSETEQLDAPEHSYVIQTGSNKPVLVFQGEGNPMKSEKRIVIGNTGILNKFALQRFATAERLYKVEGVSDMLVLQKMIPPKLLDKHIVITNAAGASDGGPPWALAPMCSHLDVVIIHDADIPGQWGNGDDKESGAARWVKAMSGSAKTVRNVQLPYEIEEKHGKDLRDWFSDGNTYADLLKLVDDTAFEAAQPGVVAVSQLNQYQLILKRLGIMVLGHVNTERGNKVICFNGSKMRRFTVSDVGRYGYHDMIINIGNPVLDEMNHPDDKEPDPALLSITDVRDAIAAESKDRALKRETSIGLGLWEVNGRLLAVGAGEWMAMNGGLTIHKTPEVEDRLVDFGEAGEEWYDSDRIKKSLADAMDPKWRIKRFDQMTEILTRWGNWGHKAYPDMLASLMFSQWIQDVWEWRPWIAILGESNCGKSALLRFMSNYFGKLSLSTGDCTAAGLRQAIGTNNKIVILDELESSNEREKILHWLKNSGGGYQDSLRGTSGQKSVKGQVKCIPVMASTEIGMTQETQRNRYIVFEMSSRLGMPYFDMPEHDEIEQLRSDSLAIVMATWVRAKEIFRLIMRSNKEVEIKDRYIENYAVPCSMRSAIHGLSDEESLVKFSEMLDVARNAIEETSDTEHEATMGDILSSMVHTGRDRIPVSELIQLKTLPSSCGHRADELLQRVGIWRISGERVYGLKGVNASAVKSDEDYLFFDTGLVVRELLKDTNHKGKDLKQTLVRLAGAFKVRPTLNGRQPRGVVIPASIVIEEVDPVEKVFFAGSAEDPLTDNSLDDL